MVPPVSVQPEIVPLSLDGSGSALVLDESMPAHRHSDSPATHLSREGGVLGRIKCRRTIYRHSSRFNVVVSPVQLVLLC